MLLNQELTIITVKEYVYLLAIKLKFPSQRQKEN